MATDGKPHLSIVICGHVDSGKSTTTGRLLFELGGIPEREMDKLRAEAERLGKQSFAFAFYMDRQKEERERGVTIACTTKEFFTEKWHYTVIDAPGHRDFIKNMITGASQADVALLMVPADGNFVSAIARGNHKAGEVQGQTRQHARLINLLGVKQLVIGINKMDCDVAKYTETRFNEIKEEMKSMLVKTGWKKEFVEKNVPVLPISGWIGDNLLSKSDKMAWWKGQDVLIEQDKSTLHIDTLVDALDKMVRLPERKNDAAMRMPVSGVYKIKGVGDVITGRVEQGVVKPGEEVLFLPTHTAANACGGKVFTCERHHKRCDDAKAGDNVGLNVKGLNKENMPRTGDVMVYKKDGTLKEAGTFTAQVQILDHPGELKIGYTPVCFVRTGRSAVRITQLVWKMGKETGGKKAEEPHALKANEMAEVVFAPQQPLVVDSFKNCEGLSRVAIMEGNGVVMLGKVVKTTEKVAATKGKK
jgi:elongation factor 1-alpha